jgi:hypothetical protein
VACWNPVWPAEVALGRPDRPDFTAAPPPGLRTAAPAVDRRGDPQERDR